MSIDYNKFTELMSYFYFVFNIYSVLIVIIFFNALKTIISFYRNQNKPRTGNLYDLIISTLIGFALANALFFQGVLSDVSEVESDKWLRKTLAICGASAILYVVQVVFTLLNLKKAKND